MKLIKPIIASSNASKIVENYSSEKIKVHSIFNKVINIEIGKRLICIGYSEMNISPFGVVINEEDFKFVANNLTINTVINIENSDITFDHKTILSISNSLEPLTLDLDIKHIENNRLRKNIKFLKNLVLISSWKCGFEWDFASIIKSIEGNTTSRASEFSDKVNCVCSIKHIDEKSSKEFLDYFIGRGKGLTPSGDDLIIGMLCIYNFAGNNVENFKNILGSFIKENSSKTTRISNEYLFYSLKNEFSTSLKELCVSLLYGDEKKILKDVMNIKKAGSTSPVDTIIGIIIAVHSLMED